MNIFTQFFHNVSTFFKSVFGRDEEKKAEEIKTKEIIEHQVQHVLDKDPVDTNTRFESLFSNQVKTTLDVTKKAEEAIRDKEKRDVFEQKKAEILKTEMKNLADPQSAMVKFLSNDKLISQMEKKGSIEYTMNIEGHAQLSPHTDKQKQWSVDWNKLAKNDPNATFYGDCNSMTSFISQEMYKHLKKTEKGLSPRDVVLSGSSVDQYETLVKRNNKYGQPILEKGELTANKLKEGMVIFNSVKDDRVEGRKHNIGHVAIVMEINDKLRVVEFSGKANDIHISSPEEYLNRKSKSNYIAAMHIAPKLVEQHEKNLQVEVAKLEKQMFNNADSLDNVKINGAEVKTANTPVQLGGFNVEFVRPSDSISDNLDKVKTISLTY